MKSTESYQPESTLRISHDVVRLKAFGYSLSLGPSMDRLPGINRYWMLDADRKPIGVSYHTKWFRFTLIHVSRKIAA